MKRKDIPPYEGHMQNIGNKYEFILAVSRRARMLVDGAPTAEGVDGVKSTTRGLGEMLTGKIKYKVREAEEK